MASIAEWIQRIKTAIYGEEVRGAIWQSLQAMNDELTSADVTQIPVNKADIADLKTDMTEVQGSVTSLQGSVTSLQGSVTSLQGDVETAWAEVEDIRVGADGTVYNNAGDAVRTQIADVKDDLNALIGLDKYIDADIEYKETSNTVTQTINVSNHGYVTVSPTDTVLFPCVQGETFTILVKIKSTVSQDYNYVVRLQKYTASGSTGTYYWSDAFTDDSIMVTLTATSSNVTQVGLQLVRAYTGNETSNFDETFDVEYLILIRGTVSLNSNVMIGSSNISEQAVTNNAIADAAVTLAKLQDNIKPYSIALRNGTKYPNVDTVAQTITFYSGTCIFDTSGTEIFRSTADIVVGLPTSAQQVRIVFDRDSQTFLALLANRNVNNDKYIVLGVITRAGTGRGWIGIPHTINGYDPYIKQPNPMWDLPDKWSDKVQAIQTAQGTKFTFAVQTDTHYTFNSDEYYGNNLKALTNHVGFDFVANLGDIIKGYADEVTDSPENTRAAMTQIMRRYVTGISCPLLVAMGNHDTNKMWADAFGGEPFDLSEVWAREFRPAFNTNPKAVTNTGLMYYYTDFNDVRVIVLNTQDGSNGGFGVGQAQIDWLTNTALDTSKAVLVLSHVPLVDGWSVSSNYVSSYANAVAAIKAFKTNGGTVIGCMSGHTHTQESKTVDGILYVTFRNQASLAEVVMIDLDAKTINTIPVGFTGAGNRSFTFT